MLKIGGSGASKNYVKYNAKADKWLTRGTDGKEAEIERPTFVIDLDYIATGWLRFREGQAPERVMDPSIDSHAPPNPGEGFKRGFVVMVYSPRFFGGPAEFAGTSMHLCNAINKVHDAYEAGKADNPGKLPVIACTGSQAMKGRYGINYKPTLVIVEWVDRPADLPNASPIAASEVWQGPAVPAASGRPPMQHVPPPAPKTADPLF